MGLSQSSQAEQLYEFRKLTNDQGTYEIPERPENRRPTDKKYLIAFIVVLIVLIPFLVYTLMYTELKQITGSDNCGNFCGYKNKKYDEWSCSGQDYTDRKYQLFRGYVEEGGQYLRQKECVSTCPDDYEPELNTCFKKHGGKSSDLSLEAFFVFLNEVGRDIGRGWWAILLSSVVSCLLCFGAMLLFRHAVDFVVWFILIGSVGVLAIIAGLCWYGYFQLNSNPDFKPTVKNKNANGAQGMLIMAILFSIIAGSLMIVITCMIKRVKLIIQLFKEATKAIFDIPSLILVPVWTSILVTISFLVFVSLLFLMLLAGKLTEVAPGYLDYVQNGMMITSICYHIFAYIWITEFIVGAQYLIIAGAVSAWFFTRNKHYLESPLWTAFCNFLNFHMGTVAIGSLIIAIMTIIRGLIKGLAENERTRWLIDCCMQNIEEFLRFLSKNAYIQTAMHGQPFFKSGKRAAKLLVHNAVNVIAVNSIGDFVLAIAQLLLIIVSGVAAVFIAKATGTQHYWAIAVISVFISVCMAATFFSIFEATIDSIFICFCEDTTLNDGMAKPYFMSKGLMQFIEDSKALYPKK